MQEASYEKDPSTPPTKSGLVGMTKKLKYLLYLCLFSIILGPMGALPLGIAGVNVYLTDIFIGLICLSWLRHVPLLVSLIKEEKISKYFFLFAAVCLLSFLLTPISLILSERIISGLYLVRFMAYFFVYLTSRYLVKVKVFSSQNIIKRLTLIGVTLALIGWLQYFLYPDLRNLFYLGWDPHYKRIFGSFLDPNYLGLVFVLTLIIFFFDRKSSKFFWITRLFFVFLTLAFTYSRSSFLALIVSSLYLSIKRKKLTIFGLVLFILFLSAISLPRPAGEGVKLERVFSIEQRIENWQQGIKMFSNYPILGVGFNAVRYAKRQYGFTEEDWLVTHSGAGFENSFLFVLVTTGIVGLIFYLLLLRQLFMVSNLATKASLVAIIIHSLFLNSLFFPWVILWLWIVIGCHSEPWPVERRGLFRNPMGSP